MGNVLTFTPPPKPAALELPGPVSPTELRAEIEAGAQAALDMADRFIAILDRLDGEHSREEESAAVAPFPAAAASPPAGEVEQPDDVEPQVVAAPEPEPETVVIQVPPLRWGNRGNVIAAVGVALLDMVGTR